MFFPPFGIADGSLQATMRMAVVATQRLCSPCVYRQPGHWLLQIIGCQHAENEGESVFGSGPSTRSPAASQMKSKVPGFSWSIHSPEQDGVVALPVGHPPGSQRVAS